MAHECDLGLGWLASQPASKPVGHTHHSRHADHTLINPKVTEPHTNLSGTLHRASPAVHSRWELASAAAAVGLPFVVSMYASRTIEELAHANPLAMLWQQLYLLKDRAVTASVAEHAAQTMDPTLTWKDITWLAGLTGLPVICKGVQTGEDAVAARDAGAAAVIVSHHGGRQLEGARATLDALPEVVAAVGPDFPVLMDGGIRSGRDVLVALALGAAAVLVGRPVLHGLTVADTAGATAVLTILIDELVDAMGHCGRPNLDSIGSDLVTPAAAALMTLLSTTATDADTETGTTTCRNLASAPQDRRLYFTISGDIRG
jgi:isopentenyl diphosphate isomerase/L-lactate dehydrogenase-like FMN-dependent dehydrogenase